MKLSVASQNFRKAAAIQGVRSGEVEFISDPLDGPDKVLGKAWNSRKSVTIRAGDVAYARAFTWREI